MKSITSSLVLIGVLLLLSLVGNAQDYLEIEKLILANGANAEKRLDYVFRREFSKVISANINGLIGNHVGLSTENEALSVAYNVVKQKGVLEFTFSGKINNGIADIFEDNKFKKGVSLGFAYNRFFAGKKGRVVESDVWKLKDELLDLKDEYVLKRVKIPEEVEKLEKYIEKRTKDSIALEKQRSLYYGSRYKKVLDDIKNNRLLLEESKLELEILLFQDKIDEFLSSRAIKLQQLEQAKITVPPPSKIGRVKISLDSLLLFERVVVLHDSLTNKKKLLEQVKISLKSNVFSQNILDVTEAKIEVAKLELMQARKKLVSYKRGTPIGLYNDQYLDKRNKILDRFYDIRVHVVDLTWVSLGGAISNESYDFFNGQRSVDEQIFTETDLVPSIKLSVSNYLNKPKNSTGSQIDRQVRFFAIGGEVNYGNNIADLSTITIESIDSVVGSRVISSSQKAFSGDFDSGVVSARASFDYFQMPFLNNCVGYHLKTVIDIGPFKPKTSIRGGVVVSAIKKETKTSIVNFELFYGLRDVFKDNGENSFLSRNIFGVQTTFPFNFSM